jgi:hypothetical protein
MSNKKRRGTIHGRKPGNHVEPKSDAEHNYDQLKQESGPKGQGQMNEGGPAWSGDPKVGPGPTGKDAERLL